MATYTARDGQSIYDVCLQTYGNLNLLYKLINDNGVNNINTGELAKKIFTFDDTLVKDPSIVEHNEIGGIFYITGKFYETPSTGLLTDDGFGLLTDDGIQILVD